MTSDQQWLSATTADDWELLLHACLERGDIQGVEAVLRVLAVKDPARAQLIVDLMRFAVNEPNRQS